MNRRVTLREASMSSVIGKALTINGSVRAEEPLAILGTVTGDVLVADHDVTLEADARVDGAVLARSITVRGRSVGRLVASDIVRLEDGAAVKADVAAPLFSLAEGARFNGRVEPSRVDAAFRVARYRDKA
jgi:cytoskeletal protein CcmA (bactofilin family)